MIGQVAHNFFRHFGFVMMFVTILAPIGLAAVWQRYGSSRYTRPLLTAGLVCCLVLSLVAIFPSPFIFLYNHQASDQHMTGWENTFRHQPQSENVEGPMFTGTVRLVPLRYENALAGKPDTPWYPDRVKPFPRGSVSPTDEELRDLEGFYASHEDQVVRRDHYFVASAVDRKRALEAYGGLRYSAESFRSIPAQDDVHRIQDNGEFNAYYVDQPTPAGVVYNRTNATTRAQRPPG